MKPDDPMDKLFREADEKGLWFWCAYQSLWFSPAELLLTQSEGKFRWGVENWTLRNPDEFIEEKRRALNEARRDFEHACERVTAARRASVAAKE